MLDKLKLLYTNNTLFRTFNMNQILPLSRKNILQLLKKEFNLIFNQKGQDYFALCPFHLEKTPSFAFEPEKKNF